MKHFKKLNKKLLEEKRVQNDDQCLNEGHLVRCISYDQCGSGGDACGLGWDQSCWVDICLEVDTDSCASWSADMMENCPGGNDACHRD